MALDFHSVVKLTKMTSLIGGFAVHSSLGTAALRSPSKLRAWRSKLMSRYATASLAALGIQVTLKQTGDEARDNSSRGPGKLIVSNHLSYVDVLVLAASKPTLFVTSVEVGQSAFLGHIARAGGCLFVERRSRAGLAAEVREISDALCEGINVCVFPESTSSNGEKVLPFKAALFEAAIQAGAEIQPLRLRYLNHEGRALSPEERDSICWYGDMDFLPHLIRLAALPGVRAELSRLPKVRPSDHADRYALAAEAFARISSGFESLTASGPENGPGGYDACSSIGYGSNPPGRSREGRDAVPLQKSVEKLKKIRERVDRKGEENSLTSS